MQHPDPHNTYSSQSGKMNRYIPKTKNASTTKYGDFLPSSITTDNSFLFQEYDDFEEEDAFDDKLHSIKGPDENIYKEIFEYYTKLLKDLTFKLLRIPYLIHGVIIIFSLLLIIPICLSYFASNKNYFVSNSLTPMHKIVIPYLDEMYPDLKINSSLEIFDPRFAPAMLLMYLNNHVIHNDYHLSSNLSVGFSWDDWVDIDSKLAYDDEYLIEWLANHADEFLDDITKLRDLDCKTFAFIYGCENNLNFMNQCEDIGEEENRKDYPYKFRIKGLTSARLREQGRLLLAGSYLKFTMPPPARIYMLDIFGENGEGSLMINVDDTKNDNRNKIARNKDIIQAFVDIEMKNSNKEVEQFLKDGISIENLRNKLSNTISYSKVDRIIHKKDHIEIDHDQTYLALDSAKDEGMRQSNWEFSDFLWDEDEFLDSLNDKADAQNNDNYDYLLNEKISNLEQFRIENGYHPKYLSEADLYAVNYGSHYDWRFFSGSLILDDHRKSVIHRLSRTWLRFCLENDIKTFIAYGSMLGWIRNGLTLPWDSDIDVIVTMKSLNLLARNFNQTLIIDYSSKDTFSSAMTGYLLDINPAYYSRFKGDGNNVIDGRLIDISTGMYLDITALAWTDDYLNEITLNKKLKKIVDKDFEINQYFAVEGDDVYVETLMTELRKLQDEKQLVHCKNDNVYKISELSTMIPSYFEGVRAYFPHAYEEIIWRLYPKALTRITEPGHVFDHIYHLWVSTYDCPGIIDPVGNIYVNAMFGECTDEDVLKEWELTRNYTSRHLEMVEQKEWDKYVLSEDTESKPFRIDEFFLMYSTALGYSEEDLFKFYYY